MSAKEAIILLLLLVVIWKLVRWQEAMDNRPSFTPPRPPSPSLNDWYLLHRDFDYSQVNLWKQKGYDYSEANRWIRLGINPGELNFLKWIREKQGLSPEQLTNSEVSKLRCEWKISKLPPGVQGFY